ncbi:MAG: ribonuclease HII [Candidatus Paceibacterota bacterium]|jgi:ribonuclease HII
MKYFVGVDEVGRGPLAGPVAVGVLVMKGNFKNFGKISDSKQLSEKQREEWFEIIRAERERGALDFSVSFISHTMIDKRGLTWALRIATARSLARLAITPTRAIFLDGGLRAPDHFKNQQTIVKGDEKISVIALASIVAKVTRDRLMVRLAKKYPQYGFEKHKGYGTKEHYQAIKKYGLCPIHRKSFLLKFSHYH